MSSEQFTIPLTGTAKILSAFPSAGYAPPDGTPLARYAIQGLPGLTATYARRRPRKFRADNPMRKEHLVPSLYRVPLWRDAIGYLRQMHYPDFLMATLPVGCMLFILSIVLQA